MATASVPNITTYTVLDSSPVALRGVLRDANGAVTHLGEFINGNSYSQTESVLTKIASTTQTLDSSAGIWLTSATITLTMPVIAAVGAGRHLRIFKTDSGTTVTVNSSDGSTFNGSATVTLTSQFSSKLFFTDSSNWFVI